MTRSSTGGGTGEDETSDGWLPYDAPTAAGSDTHDGQARDPDGGATHRADHMGAVDEGPWLRFDVAEADEQAAGRPPRDPAWLEPELAPAEAAAEPAGEADQDTGVPPTLVEPAHPRPTGPGEQAAHDVHDTAGHGTAGEDTGPDDTAPRVGADTPVLGAAGDGPGREADPGRDGKGRGKAKPAGRDEPVGALSVLGAAVKELAIVVGMALVLSFVVKTWLLQAFYIPSGSMEDTLQINDRVIVSKLTPGPIDLERGDIVVFADPGDWLEPVVQQPHGTTVTVLRDAMMFIGLLPDNSENHLIKRVIGLPGDHVKCCDQGGRITVNGVPVKEPYIMPGDAASESDFDITVPRGRVWVMGDHRSDSSDSRFHDAPENNGTQGSVDERLIVGRAVAIVWPLDHLTWLSNPTATFAKVPNPGPGLDQGSAPDAPGAPAGDAPPGGESPPGGGD